LLAGKKLAVVKLGIDESVPYGLHYGNLSVTRCIVSVASEIATKKYQCGQARAVTK
jgi:hypothetical protein